MKKTAWYRLLTIISAIMFLSWAWTGGYYSLAKKVFVSPFDYTLSIYQRNVVNANSIPQAIQNIDIALEYIEKNGLMEHEIDINLRREALKKYRAELAQLRPELSISRRFNDIMMLRGTLVDRKNFGSMMTVVVSTSSLKKYYALWGIGTALALVVFLSLWFAETAKSHPHLSSFFKRPQYP